MMTGSVRGKCSAPQPEHVRAHLARYKAPRHVVMVPSIGRSPAGKVDYKGLRQLAVDELSSHS